MGRNSNQGGIQMTITITLVGIAVLILGISMVLMASNIKSIKEDVDKANFESDQNHRAIVQIVSTSNQNTKTFEGRFAQRDRDIDAITDHLRSIAEDIRRLDNDVAQVAHDERDLKRYYINYRQPVLDNAGCDWAEDYKCDDD